MMHIGTANCASLMFFIVLYKSPVIPGQRSHGDPAAAKKNVERREAQYDRKQHRIASSYGIA